jgi:hypothetical protein
MEVIRLKPFLETLINVLTLGDSNVVEANSDGEEIVLFLSETAPIKHLEIVSPTGKKFRLTNKDLMEIVENSE